MNDGTRQDRDSDPLMLRWVFTKATEGIDLFRSSAVTSTQVEVVVDGHMRVFRFADRPSAVAFHAGFEHALLQTGWQLTGFVPERRAEGDRRTLQRGLERRGALSLVWSQQGDRSPSV